MFRHRTGLLSVGKFFGIALTVALIAPGVRADFELFWCTIDGGGAQALTGGGFELSSTVGQPDAGIASGGTFQLDGGFWPGVGDSAFDPCPDRSKTKGTYKSGNAVSAGLVRYAPDTEYEVELIDKNGTVVDSLAITTDASGKGKATFRNVVCTGAPHKIRNVACDVSKSVKKNCGP